jgi:site-specific recombinase XerD
MNREKLLNDYIKFMKINLQYSKVTIIGYKCLLKKFLSWIKHNPITSNDVRDFLEYFSSKYESKNTYSNMLKVLKVFFREYLHSNIVESFRFPSAAIIPKTVPTKEELRKFYNEIPTLKEKGKVVLLNCC